MNAFGLRIHDTWWMTETGGQVICNYPCMEIRPGSMGKPIPGVKAAIVDNEGNEVPPYTMGNLAIAKGWPSMMRGSGITSKNMNLISCREIGTYQATLPIWMKMDTSGSKDVLTM